MNVTAASYPWPLQTLPVHEEDGCFWTECALCPGFTATAPSFGELYRLVSEFHADKPHGWLLMQAVEPLLTTTNAGWMPA